MGSNASFNCSDAYAPVAHESRRRRDPTITALIPHPFAIMLSGPALARNPPNPVDYEKS